MKSPLAVLTLALSLVVAPATAGAQPVSARSGPDTYLELHLGAFLPQAKDLDSLDPGVALSGTFGAMLTPMIGAEATAGYYRAAGTARFAPPIPSVDTSLSVIPVLASVRLVAPFKPVELSARAGVGIHFATVHPTGTSDASATAFGFHLGASAAFNISPTMLVGVDVLGSFAQAKFDGASTRLDGLVVALKLGYRL
jgi:opacity protein-like surface antigen